MVDKNLFLHDLTIVAIIKNEGHYLKEWLDYHLLAGVDHFYLYDNDSTDNQGEIVAPYVEVGLVDYIPVSGKAMQMFVYNDAVKRFKFQSRYMAFIDCDEFIFPKNGQSIVEAVDEILSGNSNAAAVGINWQIFGSNGQIKADYSRGVLERFTRRAPSDWVIPIKRNNLPGGNAHVKTIANPRKINFICSPHFSIFFNGFYPVNENNVVFNEHFNNPVTAKKIVINHYYTKSYEEFRLKQDRGRADLGIKYSNDWFDMYDRNEVFDDGILKYRAARAENFSLESDADKIRRVTETLTKILLRNADGEIFDLETALTCRALSTYLRKNFPSQNWEIYEETSLATILKSISNGVDSSTAKIFIRDLPNLLKLPYPFVKELHKVTLQIISELIYCSKMNMDWLNFVELNYLKDLLRSDLFDGRENF